MNARARWIIGILLALVIGLGVGLALVAGDDQTDPETVTVTTEQPDTTSETAPETETQTAPSQGGVSPPSPGQPDGSGGLGSE